MQMGRVPASSSPLAALLVARAALGLAQSCLMPAMSALAGEAAQGRRLSEEGNRAACWAARTSNPAPTPPAARWFPPATRGQQTSAVYSCYSVGTVFGLALTPLVSEVRWEQNVIAAACAGPWSCQRPAGSWQLM